MIIYLDESGDLGWTFTAPYRAGGSSRYMTIASLAVSRQSKHLPKRLIRKLYQKYNWLTNTEKKRSSMTVDERLGFAQQARALCSKHPGDIRYLAITVKKENVQEQKRQDANLLYNYMISQSLIDEMATHAEITFVPDPKSIKVKSGNSLHDYLQTELWYEKGVATTLTTQPCDSSSNFNVQFSDMLSGVVQSHFEDGKSKPWFDLCHQISHKQLFF